MLEEKILEYCEQFIETLPQNPTFPCDILRIDSTYNEGYYTVEQIIEKYCISFIQSCEHLFGALASDKGETWFNIKDIKEIIGDKSIKLGEHKYVELWEGETFANYMFTQKIFSIISEDVVRLFNERTIFTSYFKVIDNLPCFIAGSQNLSINSRTQFDIWVNMLKKDANEYPFYYDKLEKMDFCAKFTGSEVELENLPQNVDFYYYEHSLCSDEYISHLHNMKVYVDKDDIVHIAPSKRSLCAQYEQEILDDIIRINYKMGNFSIVSGSLEDKIQFLIDNKYESRRLRIKRIVKGEEADSLIQDADDFEAEWNGEFLRIQERNRTPKQLMYYNYGILIERY